MYFVFQESMIWEGSNNRVDPYRRPITIKAKTVQNARKKLKSPELGRVWIFIKVK